MRIRRSSRQSRNMVRRVLNTGIGVQPLQDIDEVNMFKDDNTVINFKKPTSKGGQELCSLVFGERELAGGDGQP